MLKLHLGCGSVKKQGWVNIDSEPSCQPDMVRDLSQRLPYDNDSVDFIYAEHFFEHLSLEEGLRFLRECRRVLKPLGVIRLSMPDLAQFAKDYLEGVLNKWESAGWVPATPAQMMNEEFRNWGHRFIYDFEELNFSFQKSGFIGCDRRHWGKSMFEHLQSVETRPEHWGDLVVEAVK